MPVLSEYRPESLVVSVSLKVKTIECRPPSPKAKNAIPMEGANEGLPLDDEAAVKSPLAELPSPACDVVVFSA